MTGRLSIKYLFFLFSTCALGITYSQTFIENSGQLLDQFGNQNSLVQYSANYGNFRVYLNTNGFSYELIHLDSNKNELANFIPIQYNRIDVTFHNNSFSGTIEKSGSGAVKKFYRGDSTYHSNSYESITYKNIYPKIDVVFYAQEKGFKYDFVVHPGGRLEDIQLVFDSPFETNLTNHEIQINAPLGLISEQVPNSFLTDSKQEIDIRFTQNELQDGTLSFSFQAPNQPREFSETLVIDPIPNLWFGTYISGNFDEHPENVTVDDTGEIYVTGYTNSVNNIATSGTYQGTFNAVFDVFLVKYKPDGNKLWGSYMGGNSFDRAYGLTFKNGKIYLSGNTFSQNFATAGVHQTTNMNADDAFLAQFDVNGNRIWCTYYGGEAHDFASTVLVNSNDEIYITGHTLSYSNIATSGVHMESFFGISAAFLAKFNNQGQLIWGTYYGNNFDEGYGLAFDSNENIVFSGSTNSTTGIASLGAHQPANGGGVDAFLAKFNPNGQRLWGTFLGGPATDQGYDVCIDASDNIYVVGNTSSLSGISSGTGYQLQPGSIDDGFVAKYSSNGSQIWSTYIGGSEADYISAVQLYFDQSIVLVGKTQSSNDIATGIVFSGNLAGQYDAFMMKINPSGNLEWGTYFGGSLSDEFTGLAINQGNGFLHTSGMTLSTDGISSPTAHQTTPGQGQFHGFLARFCAPFTPSFITEIQPISCGNTDYSVEVDPAIVFTDFEWHDGSNAPTFNFSNLVNGEYFYFLSTIDTNGCAFTTDTIFFQVLPDVDIGLEIQFDQNSSFCEGTATNFFPNESFENYAWSNGEQTETLTITHDESGEQYIALSVSNIFGCTASDTLFYEVLDAPEPQLNLSGAANFCLGESVLVSTTVSYETYAWSNGSANTQTSISEDSWIWVSVSNDLACNADSDSIWISSTALLPDISVLNSAPFCPNTLQTFSVDNAFNSYTWSSGEVTSSVNVQVQTGSQWIAIEVTNLCDGVGFDTLHYEVFPEIDLNIGAQIPELLCIGSTVEASVPETFSEPIWQNTSTGYDYQEQASQFGSWSIFVQALDENDCLVYDTLQVFVEACVLVLDEEQQGLETKVYPNPVQNELFIDSPTFQMGKILIFDATGSLVESIEVSGASHIISTQKYADGLYLLRILDLSGAAIESVQFIKHKP